MIGTSPIYLVYLADVGRNYACFAVFTHYIRMLSNRHEVRVPSLLNQQGIDKTIYSLDKCAPIIEDWPQLYSWLGRRSGWASFSIQAAANLVPHWLGETVEYECSNSQMQDVDFVDSSLFDNNTLEMLKFDLVGTSPDEGSFMNRMDISGNLVASMRPVFA